MRWLTFALIAVLILLQYPLWLGKGGWLRVWDYDYQLSQQKEANRKLETRNAGLDAEVRDLKQGYEAIEERARFELGMIKQDEVFVQIPERPAGDNAGEIFSPSARKGEKPSGGRNATSR
ncbi:MAG: cell division protein FtsB [Zoogloeaceae bacterium]|nr:cell division protein FtsB [Zoogloeaceae bacterium]